MKEILISRPGWHRWGRCSLNFSDKIRSRYFSKKLIFYNFFDLIVSVFLQLNQLFLLIKALYLFLIVLAVQLWSQQGVVYIPLVKSYCSTPRKKIRLILFSSAHIVEHVTVIIFFSQTQPVPIKLVNVYKQKINFNA